MEVQTRSEETGLQFFTSLQEAFNYAEVHKDVWKISFNAEDGSRCRFVKALTMGSGVVWKFEPILTEQSMERISPSVIECSAYCAGLMPAYEHHKDCPNFQAASL